MHSFGDIVYEDTVNIIQGEYTESLCANYTIVTLIAT